VVATIKFSWLLPESCGRAAARSPIAAPPIHSPLQLPIRRQRHTHHITAQGDIRRLDLRTPQVAFNSRCSWVFTIVPWGAVGHTRIVNVAPGACLLRGDRHGTVPWLPPSAP
jgi:hypothetical protein